jgi:hypothetical protein
MNSQGSRSERPLSSGNAPQAPQQPQQNNPAFDAGRAIFAKFKARNP